MKKITAYITLSLCWLLAAAQGNVQTKQFVLSDFYAKTLKVVLTGNEMLDAELRTGIQEIWHLSPYEFCNAEEFEALKKSDDYYFMTLTRPKASDKKSGINFFSIFKGRKEAQEGVDGLYKVISMPYCSADENLDEQALFIAPVLSALHDNIARILSRTLNTGFIAVAVKHPSLQREGRTLLVSRDALGFDMGSSLEEVYKDEGIIIAENDVLDDAIAQRSSDHYVCHCICPENTGKGSTKYILIFDACTYELLYIKSYPKASADEWGISHEQLRALIPFMKAKK